MKGYKNILLGFFLSEFGRAMYFVSITWFLFQLTNDASYTGLMIGFGFLPGLVLNLFFGVIVDKYDRRKLTILATLVSTVLMFIILVCFLVNCIEPWIIISVHMLLQVAGSLFRPAIQTFIAEYFISSDLPKIFSNTSSAATIGGLLGSSVGGLIIGFLSVTVAMSIVTASFTIALLALFLLEGTKNSNSHLNEKTSFLSQIIDGFIYLKKNPFLLGLFFVMFNGQLVFHNTLGFLSVYTDEFLKQTATTYGLLDATISCGGAIAGILGTWWWKKSRSLVAFNALLVAVLGLILMGISSLLITSFLGVFLIGLGTTWIRVLLQSIQQMATEKKYHGRMASYRMIGNQGAVVISSPVLGYIASNFGANFIFISLIIPIGICIVFAFFQSKQKKLNSIIRNVA